MSKFTAAAVFSNNMVLQREKGINVFGYGNDGETAEVSFCGNTAKATVKNGRWLVTLPPMQAGGPYEMTVSGGGTTQTFVNVMVGEVWLAGGQSNMELELRNCTGGKEVLENDKNPDVRYYYTQKMVITEADFSLKESQSGWSEFGTEYAKCWSAVGYFFARELAAKLGVTVGIIGCYWGGTSASHWMSRQALICDCDTRLYVDEYDEAIKGKTEEELSREYDEYQEYDREWNKKSAEFYANNPDGSWDECCEYCGPNKFPGPLCPRNPFHPAALYESMLQRVCPYTLKGFLYYQGESDDHRAKSYLKLLGALIKLWREDWGDDELAFLIVQLPMHRYKADSDTKKWCYIREAQMRTYKTVKNTGLAVIIDCGEFNEIHPKDKLPVGHRLYLQAMYNIYGDKDIDAFGPVYRSHICEDGKIRIMFDYAEKGYTIKGENGLTGFEVAGEDKVFYTADAVIGGDNTITVSAKGVNTPVYVRYLWTNYSEVSVYGANGLPMAPFRTHLNDE